MIGACEKIAAAASMPAKPQAAMLTKLTGMPSSSARSPFSLAARSAMPSLVRLRKYMSENDSASTTMNANTWLPVTSGSPRELRHCRCCHGVVTFGTALARSPNQIGMKKPSAAYDCATPMVTTVTISRDAFLNRRSTTTSVKMPVRAPPTRAIGIVSR